MNDMQVPPERISEKLILLLRHFKAVTAYVTETHDLTMLQFLVLYILSRHGVLTMSEIAHQMHCDLSNITGIVKRLHSRGLVDHKNSPDDRRFKELSLTPKGTMLTAELMRQLPHHLGCDRLSEAEATALLSGIDALCSDTHNKDFRSCLQHTPQNK